MIQSAAFVVKGLGGASNQGTAGAHLPNGKRRRRQCNAKTVAELSHVHMTLLLLLLMMDALSSAIKRSSIYNATQTHAHTCAY